MLGMQTLKQIS